jgi:MFS family permease
MHRIANSPLVIRSFISRFSPRLWLIILIGFLNSAGFALSMPFLALYLFENRGVDMAHVGIIMLISGLCSAVAQLFAGAITDRWGRKPILVITISASAGLFVVMAVLLGLASPVVAIAAVYCAERSVLMMQRPAIQAMVVDVSPKERLMESYGLLRAGQNVGWAAGPALGGFLAAALTYPWLFGVAAGIVAVALILVIFFLTESFGGSTEKINFSHILEAGKDTRLLAFAGLCLLVFIVMGQMGSTLSVFTVSHAGFSTTQYGFLLTLNGLIVAVLQYPFAVLTGRLGKSLSLTAGAILYGLGYLTMAWVGGFSLAIGAMVVITFGEIIFAPTTMAVVGELSSPNWRGRYMAFFGLSETLGMSFGPLMGGILLDRFSATPLLVWGPIAAAALIAAVGFNGWGIGWRGRKD